MVSVEIAVAMAVPIENSVECEAPGVIHYLQADEILRSSCRRGKLWRRIVLLHDKRCPHTAQQTEALPYEQFHWGIFEHPPYSSDLAPLDFFLFPKIEHLLVNDS